MKVYPINKIGQKMINLECSKFLCKHSVNSVTTVIWQIDNYNDDRYCEKCKSVLIEK